MVDMSGSIAEQGYKSELQFISNLVDYFDIGPTQTQVSMISYDSNNRLDFDFKTHSTAASLKFAISSASYTGGGTKTSKAIDLARTQFSSTSSGVRPDSEGVSKVLVVLTDGSSDDPAGAIAAAEKVKALNVNIFTIGLGSSLNRNELLGMATEPQEEHFIELSQVKDIEAFSSTMATYSCNEPAKINPGESFRTDISDGEMRYVEPSCQVLTDHFIVDAYDLKGFTSLFVSTQSKNPGPFDYEKKSEVPGRKRIYMETPGNDPIYIGLWSLRCGANRDEITDSEVSFDFLNDIFNGFMIDFAEVREHQSEGLEVYRPKAPSFSKGVSIPNIVYSLENADDTIGANSTLPFAIHPSDGTVTTSEELEFDENQKWRIRILAHADGTAELSRCIRGGMEVIVSVIPDSTSPTTTATSTATSTATTTATSTATTTEDPAIAAAAARAKAQRTAIGAAVPIVLLLLLALLAFLYVRDKRKWPTEKEIMAMDMDECKECLRAHGIDPKIEYPEIRFTDQIRLLLADLAGHNSTYSKKSFALKEAVWPKSKEEIANMKRFDMLQILKKNGSPNASKLKKTSEIRGLLLMASGFAVDVIADTAPKMFNDGTDDAKSNGSDSDLDLDGYGDPASDDDDDGYGDLDDGDVDFDGGNETKKPNFLDNDTMVGEPGKFYLEKPLNDIGDASKAGDLDGTALTAGYLDISSKSNGYGYEEDIFDDLDSGDDSDISL